MPLEEVLLELLQFTFEDPDHQIWPVLCLRLSCQEGLLCLFPLPGGGEGLGENVFIDQVWSASI